MKRTSVGKRKSLTQGRLLLFFAPLLLTCCSQGPAGLQGPASQPLTTSALIEKATAAGHAVPDCSMAVPVQTPGAESKLPACPSKEAVVAASGVPPVKRPLPESTSAGSDAVIAAHEYFVDFDPDVTAIPDKSRIALAAAVQVNRAAGFVKANLIAGRGGRGNGFDQVLIAQKRARFVNDLLPKGMVISSEFDPSLPEDTVRIDFIAQPAVAGKKS